MNADVAVDGPDADHGLARAEGFFQARDQREGLAPRSFQRPGFQLPQRKVRLEWVGAFPGVVRLLFQVDRSLEARRQGKRKVAAPGGQVGIRDQGGQGGGEVAFAAGSAYRARRAWYSCGSCPKGLVPPVGYVICCNDQPKPTHAAAWSTV